MEVREVEAVCQLTQCSMRLSKKKKSVRKRSTKSSKDRQTLTDSTEVSEDSTVRVFSDDGEDEVDGGEARRRKNGKRSVSDIEHTSRTSQLT